MTTTAPRTLFVGESPPRGAPADFRPFDCDSGKRLCKVLGFTGLDVLLNHVPRTNIFHEPTGIPGTPKWSESEARKRGVAIINAHRDAIAKTASYVVASTVVALGRKVVEALGVPDLPAHSWTPHEGVHIVALPHPSGRNASASLNDEHTRAEYRRAALPELVAGCPTLRPWHFDLTIPTVLADLGAALCPNDHALGVAVAVVASEMHRAKAAPKGIGLDIYRTAMDVTMNDLAYQIASAKLEDLRDLIANQCVIDVRKIMSELKARAVFADRTVPAPSSEYRRALVGRYVSLGVW